jgi:hypothetical protein
LAAPVAVLVDNSVRTPICAAFCVVSDAGRSVSSKCICPDGLYKPSLRSAHFECLEFLPWSALHLVFSIRDYPQRPDDNKGVFVF